MLNFFKDTLQTIYAHVSMKMHSLFTRTVINENELQELEQLLLKADTGVTTTRLIMQNIKKGCQKQSAIDGPTLKNMLSDELMHLLTPYTHAPEVILLVGINGSGKTTAAAKFAYYYQEQGKKVLLVAADTFRAAGAQQLEQWAHALHIDIITNQQKDPGSVVFQGCTEFTAKDYDVLIIDTAGRLQTKSNLMHELAKIKKIIAKKLPEKKISTLLTIDAMLGQNSLEQAKLFNEAITIDGVILTKMDGTGKGGIVFAINHQLKIPVAYITIGEQKDKLQVFSPKEYVRQLLNQ